MSRSGKEKKDKTTKPPRYLVFFKGRDADVIAQAFKGFVYGNEKRKAAMMLILSRKALRITLIPKPEKKSKWEG